MIHITYEYSAHLIQNICNRQIKIQVLFTGTKRALEMLGLKIARGVFVEIVFFVFTWHYIINSTY